MTLRRLLVVVVLPAALLTGCADKRITLRYTPEGAPAPLTGGKAITVFQFDDRRGSVDVLEEALNKALAKFIRAVVTDPDITRQINGS